MEKACASVQSILMKRSQSHVLHLSKWYSNTNCSTLYLIASGTSLVNREINSLHAVNMVVGRTQYNGNAKHLCVTHSSILWTCWRIW